MFEIQKNSQILFLSKNNYCRSRFAELLYNHLVTDSSGSSYAFSRGLKPFDRNLGRISPFVLNKCHDMGIEIRESQMRAPRLLSESDFIFPQLIISIGDVEQSEIVKCQFPNYLPAIEFWDVPNPTPINQSACFQITEYKVLRLVKRIFENSAREIRPSEVVRISA